jgi:hypothetical protein
MMPRKYVTPNEIVELGKELDRLFALQDRPLSNDRGRMIVDELLDTGMPFSAMKAGIRDLCDQDIKSLKFVTIKEACRKHCVQAGAVGGCELCHQTGTVTMESVVGKYVVNYPCICKAGADIAQAQMLVQWNGQKTMKSKVYGDCVLTEQFQRYLGERAPVVTERPEPAYRGFAERELEPAGAWRE